MGAGYTSLYSYSNAATLGSNVYYSSGANRYFASSVNASAYQQLGGVHYWLQAASGTAGNAITFTQAMTLDASGNLGIGVAPSAWGSAYRAVDAASGANGGGAFSGFFSTSISRNCYNDNTNWRAKYSADERPALYSQPYGGGHQWFNGNPFVTANGIVTMTQAMTLDVNGNLGIGTTSPDASAILDAQSTTKGVRMPNMTTTQKNAIVSPAAGLMVFDTTLAKLCVYSGSAWQTITSV
jgi:hypothetical protein